MSEVAGIVEAVWRYPIKSLGGERLRGVAVDARGVVGDRLYAVRDANGKFGSGKSTRRFRRMDGLLRLRSRYPGGLGDPELLDPDGKAVPDATAFLRGYLARDDIEVAAEGEVPHFDELALSVLTTATLSWAQAAVPGATVDERRFRPNLLVRTAPGTRPFVEDDWLGRTALIGQELCVQFARSSERCVMVNEAQQELPHSPLLLKTVATSHDNKLGALATIARCGYVGMGDAVTFA